MGFAKDFNRIIHNQIDVHAAWLPVTNTFAVGDFGVISDGVFTRMGNITDSFDVTFDTKDGDPSALNFSSSSVREFKLVAGAEVDVLPDNPGIQAKLRIEFGRERAVYLKAALTSTEMKEVFPVAQTLLTKPGWDARRFKVVYATYRGESCVLLSSLTADSAFEISGDAPALSKFSLGEASAGLTITSKKELGLQVTGEGGVVGLRLFKVGRKRALPQFLAMTQPTVGKDDQGDLVFTDLSGLHLEDDL